MNDYEDSYFKIGDRVRIANLKVPNGRDWNGEIGHEGKVVKIDVSTTVPDSYVYYLEPSCTGGCWMQDHLEFAQTRIQEIKELTI